MDFVTDLCVVFIVATGLLLLQGSLAFYVSSFVHVGEYAEDLPFSLPSS
jgi:hypothetical protein